MVAENKFYNIVSSFILLEVRIKKLKSNVRSFRI